MFCTLISKGSFKTRHMYLHLDMALLVGGPRQAHTWKGGGAEGGAYNRDFMIYHLL